MTDITYVKDIPMNYFGASSPMHGAFIKEKAPGASFVIQITDDFGDSIHYIYREDGFRLTRRPETYETLIKYAIDDKVAEEIKQTMIENQQFLNSLRYDT